MDRQPAQLEVVQPLRPPPQAPPGPGRVRHVARGLVHVVELAAIAAGVAGATHLVLHVLGVIR